MRSMFNEVFLTACLLARESSLDAAQAADAEHQEHFDMSENIPCKPPSYRSDGFNYPFCQAFSYQDWGWPDQVINNTVYGCDD